MLTRRRALLAGCALVLAACSERAASPPAATRTLRVISSHADDGAILVELTGEVVGVDGSAGVQAIPGPSAGGTTQVLLLRETGGPFEFLVRVRDGSEPPAARVLEVSDVNDQPRPVVSDYRVELR